MSLSARVVARSIAIALTLACASDGILGPPSGFPNATAGAFCAPNDGPAVAIYLSPTPAQLYPSMPYVRVAIWKSLDALTGRVWRVGPGSVDAWATFQVTDTDYESASSGYLTVTSVSADNRIEGTLDIIFPTTGRVRGGFKADWIAQRPLCG